MLACCLLVVDILDFRRTPFRSYQVRENDRLHHFRVLNIEYCNSSDWQAIQTENYRLMELKDYDEDLFNHL